MGLYYLTDSTWIITSFLGWVHLLKKIHFSNTHYKKLEKFSFDVVSQRGQMCEGFCSQSGNLTWGMIVSFDLKSCRPMVDMSQPSIHMLPSTALMMRKSAKVRDDFPAPVRPTIPICKYMKKNNDYETPTL